VNRASKTPLRAAQTSPILRFAERKPSSLRRTFSRTKSRSMLPLDSKHNRLHGFVLWEMLLALSIFSIVALSLTIALQQAANTARLLRQDSQVRHELESILAESTTIKLATGKNEIATGDQRVHYQREIVPVLTKNSRGQLVDHLWRVTVRANWQETNQSRSSQAEIIVYQP
jgi:prepilin-type N-terminal cleavage/methylation domain-containing protein